MSDKTAAAEPSFDKYMVLILGMHRSGTSTLAGALHYTGCALPKDLMLATEDNPKGYFESLAVSIFNEKMLKTTGATWRDWHPIDASWFASPVGKAFLPQARDLLKAEFDDAPLIVFKDPRVCRMVEFWKEAAALAKYRVLPVLVHRNPVEVAASLKKRDGIDLVEGGLIWLRHVLDAEKATRNQPRAITSYDRVLTDWSTEVAKIQKNLDLILPRTDRRSAILIEDFLSPDLRHFSQPAQKVVDNDALLLWVRDTYEIFERWATKGEVKADHKTLDRIAAQVDAITPVFAELVDARKAQIKTLNDKMAQQATERQTQDGSLSKALEELEKQQAELAESKTRAEQRDATLAERDAQVEEHKTEAERTRQRAEAAEASLKHKAAAYEARLGELSRMAQLLNESEERARIDQSEIKILREQTTQVADREAELERLRNDLSQAESALAQRNEEAEQAWKQAQSAEASMQEKAASLEVLTAQQQVHLSELSQMARLLNQSDERFEANQLEIQNLQEQIAARGRETAAQQAHIGFVENELAAIRASRFWRATGPMRRFLNAVRGALNAVRGAK